MLLDIALGLFVAALVLAIVGRSGRRHLSHVERADTWRAEFFASAKKLVLDERVPDDIAELLDYMAEHICRADFLRRFTVHVLLNGSRKLRRGGDRLAKSVARMDEGQKRHFATAVGAFGIAVTYNNVLLGPIFRRLFWVISVGATARSPDDNRLEAVARDVAYCARAA